ncbi:hypothetical protein M231_02204 [Tremella mesenterica]|uniref:Telomere length regulation protein conserved domain-containing protein n=1 Tax=Tremella mesenterica TaxID=5217 RepID=A0A4Q1BRN3_TREME|nr:hypothetical protein M231_02204 [Tremella mesenterica]
MTSDHLTALRHLRDTLQSPIPDVDSFSFLLSSTLQSLHLHSTSVPSSTPEPSVLKAIQRFLPSVQQLLLTNAVPTFLHALDEGHRALLDILFCPAKSPSFSQLHVARRIAFISYLTLSSMLLSKSDRPSLPTLSRQYLLETLRKLSGAHGIDQLYWAVWGGQLGEKEDDISRQLQWEDTVKAIVGLPAKVANAVGRWKAEGWEGDVPIELIPRSYFHKLAVSLESIIYETSQSQRDPSPFRAVFEKLSSVGLISTSPSVTTSPTPSILGSMMPPLLSHLRPPTSSPLPPYPSTRWPSLLLGLPTSSLSNLVESLLQHLTFHLHEAAELEPDRPDERIARAVEVLTLIIGPPEVGGEAWEAVARTIVNKKITVKPMNDRECARIRICVSWMGQAGEKGCKTLLDKVIDAWTDAKYVKFSLYSQQFYLTYIVLLAISLFPPFHPHIISLSHRPQFILSLQAYLGHPDPKVRRLGMLVAEILSERTMEDDMWDGEGNGKEECRWLRRAVGVKDGQVEISDDPTGKAWLLGWKDLPVSEESSQSPTLLEPTPPRSSAPAKQAREKGRAVPTKKIIMLDPDQEADPLSGYTLPSPSSSRSSSPTPEFLEEVAADPSLAIGKVGEKKVTRPVYAQQLVLLLKEREKPDMVEMGLKWGEQLVRAKRSFGTELADNAEPLVAMTVALSHSYNIEGFEEKRQGLLNSLVVCAPKQAAPYLIELYFTGQYALQQRSIILTALAMGARELSGMSIPLPPSTKKIDFPSKILPPNLHRKYISPSDIPQTITYDPLDEAISGVRDLVLSKSAQEGEKTIPSLAREKRLRVGSTRLTKVAPIGSLQETQMMKPNTPKPIVEFKDVAGEYFVMPLINRFWDYYTDSQIRESRAISSGSRYRSAGTGLILSSMALEKFLMTLALLIHSARHSPTFLAVLCPEALELALTIGARSPTLHDGMEEEEEGREAQVVGAALELVLVSLDHAFELDGGRTLVYDKSEMVLALGEWANGVFEACSKGERMGGEGGLREGKLRATAAGVVVKISDIGQKWSFLGIR